VVGGRGGWAAKGLLAGWLACVACAEPGAPRRAAVRERLPWGGTVVSFTLASEVLGRPQSVQVVVPDVHDDPHAPRPVIVATHAKLAHLAGTVADLSGSSIPPSLLVFVPTEDSGLLVPTPVAGRPTSGGADAYLRFFESELIPAIEERFDAAPFRVLHSASWGGVFCVHALLSRPGLFQGCVAATPWVIYDGSGDFLRGEAGTRLRDSTASFRGNALFVALGNDPDEGLREAVEALSDSVRMLAPEGFRFDYRYLPDEDHASIGHRAFHDGLRWIFEPWAEIPTAVLDDGPVAIQAYLVTLRGRFGYDIGAHWVGPYSRGLHWADRGDPTKANELFRVCAELAPSMPHCPSGIGRVAEEAGDWDEALAAYQDALSKAVAMGYPDLARFHDAVTRVRSRRSAPAAEEA